MCKCTILVYLLEDIRRINDNGKRYNKNKFLKRKAGISILISDKKSLYTENGKKKKREQESDYIMIKESMHQEDMVTAIFIYPMLEHLNI